MLDVVSLSIARSFSSLFLFWVSRFNLSWLPEIYITLFKDVVKEFPDSAFINIIEFYNKHHIICLVF